MRITTKVSGAGSNGLTQIPFLDISSIDDELCTDGKLDESKCRKILAKDGMGVQIASTDCLPIFAFATELLKQVHDACASMMANRKESKDAHENAECADDRHAARNMKKGRNVYVRTDITYSHTEQTITLRVNIDNPLGVVGVAERIAMDYALILARIANHIRDELTATEGNGWAFRFIGGPGCPSLFTDARGIDANLKRKAEIKEANIMMWKCERRTAGGFCSPCKFDCPHCKGGMCVELTADVK